MTKTFLATAALFAVSNLTGCALVTAGSGYHNEHGDLVSRDGDIHYVGWCDVHPHNAHCRTSAAIIAASTEEPATDR